jgi:pilus assembly protein Flp/PilA
MGTRLSALISLIRRDQEGQGLAEYALILALIAVASIVIMGLLSGQISGVFGTISTNL